MITLALITGGREHVLGQLDADPAWRRVRTKSPEGAASILVEIAKRAALDEATALILPEIQSWYRDYVKTNGSRPADSYDDWAEGHDDGVMKLFEPFVSLLSGSWLAFTSTDVQLWQEGEDEKLAKSFAQEIWKQLSWKRSDNQILAGVGITHDDLSRWGSMPPEPAPKPKPEFNQMTVNAIVNRIMLNMPDPETLEDDLDWASDDDDALALGASQRLGISMEDVAHLREARERSHAALEAWKNAIEAGELLDETTSFADIDPPLEDALRTSLDDDPLVANGLPPLPKPSGKLPPLPPLPATKSLPPLPVSQGTAPAPAVNAGRRGGRAKITNEPPAGYIPLEILRSIKEHAGTRDEDLADLLGISRPTLANVMKGKGWYVPPDPHRRSAIKSMLETHAKALMDAHSAI